MKGAQVSKKSVQLESIPEGLAQSIDLYLLADTRRDEHALPEMNEDLLIVPDGTLSGLVQTCEKLSSSRKKLVGLYSQHTEGLTGISATALKAFVHARGGYEIYFCNSAVASELAFENPWVRAVFLQPKLKDLMPGLFEIFSLPVDTGDFFENENIWVSLSHLVATPDFWKEFKIFLARGLEELEKKLAQEPLLHFLVDLQSSVRQKVADKAPFSILAEPLLMEFVRKKSLEFRALKIKSPKLLRKLPPNSSQLQEMRAVITIKQNPWLYHCWLGYRNLFLKVNLDPAFHQNLVRIQGGIIPKFRPNDGVTG